ncbi:MAG TPA: hypothetical protein DEP47_05545 [Chloroflexi bacterium]|nr:hypothetical protein [Chloroflexota bacterium]
MAIATDLNQRIDDLAAIAPDAQKTELMPEVGPADVLVPEDTQPEFEPTKVAGLSKIIPQVIKEVAKAPLKTKKPIIKEDTGAVGPYQVIKETDTTKIGPTKEEQVIQMAPSMPKEGVPSPKPGEVKTAFNLNQINDSDSFKQFIESTARAYGADKIEKISYKEIAAKAADDGYDEAFLAKVLDPLERTQADPTQAYKMMLAITDAGKRAFDLAEQVKQAKIAGTLTPELGAEFSQALALEGSLMKAARGRQADIARTLGIFSQARTATKERGAMLDEIIRGSGGIESIHDLASKYTALDSRSARASLSEKTISGRLTDVWFSTWINGLLSSPVTQAKNIAGNLAFGAIQIPERAVASIIGKARNFAFGGEEAIQMNETYSMAIGFMQGMREGFAIGGRAFMKNEPTDAFQKIEQAKVGRDTFEFDLGDSVTGRALSGALKYYGNFVTLPGRAMMSVDEMFKAIGYRVELNSIATREYNIAYRRMVESGIPEDDAARQAAEITAKILADPTESIDDAAKSMARTVTFTKTLGSSERIGTANFGFDLNLQAMQGALQNPLLKMFAPFVRTPTNIAMEAMARTPGLNFASPRFWGDYNAGGIRRDMAMARVTLGAGITFAAGSYALEGRLTGYGPMRVGDKETLKGTGWQEFSLVFNKDDVSPALLEDYKKITKVNVGPDKVYVSYAGLEPLGTLLALSATAGEYSMMASGGADMEKIMMGASLGIYEYMKDQPMLKGVSDLMNAFQTQAKDMPSRVYNIMSAISKQATTFGIGGSPAGAYSSAVAAVERIMKPEKSQVMEAFSEEENSFTAGAAKGFWEAMNTYCSRNPLCSDKLPPQLDPITGEVKKIGQGNWSEAFNPFKRSDGTWSDAYRVLAQYGIPAYRPPKKMDGVELNAQQYNRWIELATRDGKLENEVRMIGDNSGVQRLAEKDLSAAQGVINKHISDVYSDAKKLLIIEDKDLGAAIQAIKEEQMIEGKYKR